MNPFVCGNLSNLDEDEDGSYRNPLASSRKLRRNSFCRRSENRDGGKNPYSKRGLHKFTALLTELDEKRRKIYATMADEDEPLVHFVYKNSDDSVPVPIVINLKNTKNKGKKKCNLNRSKEKTVSRQNSDASEASDKSSVTGSPPKEVGNSVSVQAVEPEKKGLQKNQNLKTVVLSNWKRPSYYLPAIVILILLFLVFFSRSAAIMWTCIGWYVVPASQGDSSDVRRPTKKKDYVRRLSDKNGRVSFNGQTVGAVGNKSPPHAAAPVTGKGR